MRHNMKKTDNFFFMPLYGRGSFFDALSFRSLMQKTSESSDFPRLAMSFSGCDGEINFS